MPVVGGDEIVICQNYVLDLSVCESLLWVASFRHVDIENCRLSLAVLTLCTTRNRRPKEPPAPRTFQRLISCI